jgi:hypothetical protein
MASNTDTGAASNMFGEYNHDCIVTYLFEYPIWWYTEHVRRVLGLLDIVYILSKYLVWCYIWWYIGHIQSLQVSEATSISSQSAMSDPPYMVHTRYPGVTLKIQLITLMSGAPYPMHNGHVWYYCCTTDSLVLTIFELCFVSNFLWALLGLPNITFHKCASSHITWLD